MIAFLIWIVGLILTIKACLEIWKLPVDGAKKLMAEIEDTKILLDAQLKLEQEEEAELITIFLLQGICQCIRKTCSGGSIGKSLRSRRQTKAGKYHAPPVSAGGAADIHPQGFVNPRRQRKCVIISGRKILFAQSDRRFIRNTSTIQHRIRDLFQIR